MGNVVGRGEAFDESIDNTADTFADTLARLRGPLFARALFLTQNRHAADDLVQQVYEKALLGRASFQPGTNLPAWLKRIMQNLFVDHHRKNKFWNSMAGDIAAEEPAEEMWSVSLVLSLEDVVECMREMDADDRQILQLAHFEMRSYKEIAVQMGLHPQTAGTRLFRARARLRRRLEAICTARVGGLPGREG
jgi:RNA polymerase sigma-70 factor, ECF subfamily